MTKARQLADLGNAYDDGALSNRNRIINGSFKISQRGDFSSATTITNWQYYIDRFVCYGQSNGAKITHANNSLKLEAFTTATNRMFAMTKLEPVDIQKNTTYTLSFYVTTNSSNFRVHVNDLSSPVLTYTSPSVVVPNGVRTKVSVPISVGSTVTTAFEIAIGLFASGRTNVAITSGDYFVLEEVQLELGDTATPFEHRSYGDELAKCSRYTHVLKPEQAYGRYRATYNDVGTACNTFYEFPVEMRSVPTLTSNNMSSSTFQCYSETDAGFRNPTAAFTLGESSKRHVWMSCGTATATGGAVGMWRWNNNPSASMVFDAEL
jgi:hypothetical protein